MHFVSMLSIRLRASDEVVWFLQVRCHPHALMSSKLTIQFSPGMTALSLFVPLIAILCVFWFLSDEVEYSWWRIPFAGIFVGLTSGSSRLTNALPSDNVVELMHYSAAFYMPYLVASYTVS